MTTFTYPPSSRVPAWFRAASALGIVWNLYGVYQYVGKFTDSGKVAMTAGMTAAQATIYLSLPAWISAVFALGVFGGIAGSALLALRLKRARPALAASLAGYAALFAGDAYYGVFAALPRDGLKNSPPTRALNQELVWADVRGL